MIGVCAGTSQESDRYCRKAMHAHFAAQFSARKTVDEIAFVDTQRDTILV
jgi:hypothetical protein